MATTKIDSVYDFSEKGLVELKSWLEPWFPRPGPGCCPPAASPCVTFPDRVSQLETAGVGLLGYWRLGETAAPFLDTSAYADADLSLQTLGTHHIVADVTGALDAAQDDGAVEFTGSALVQGDCLFTSVTRFHFDPSSTNYSVACWVKLNTNCGAGGLSLVAGSYSPSNYGWGLFTRDLGSGPVFSSLRVDTGGSPITGVDSPVVALGDWNFIVATYSSSAGHSLYYNGTLVDTDPTLSPVPSFNLKVGSMNTGAANSGALDGMVDELSIWGDPLTPDQITLLYLSALPCEGPGAGKVIAATGDGTTTAWTTMLTVQTGAPSTFTTPFVFDNTAVTGGLYGWDGVSYQQVGPAL